MAAIGRILGFIGFVWLAVGLFGGLVNLPDVSFFPGIILLFISRVVRKQAERSDRVEDGEDGEQDVPQEAPRMLNTQRPRMPRPQPAEPMTSTPGSLPQSPRAETTVYEPEERDATLERILLAGTEVADDASDVEPPDESGPDESGRMYSSAEMIARAHERWDRKR